MVLDNNCAGLSAARIKMMAYREGTLILPLHYDCIDCTPRVSVWNERKARIGTKGSSSLPFPRAKKYFAGELYQNSKLGIGTPSLPRQAKYSHTNTVDLLSVLI